MENNNSMAELLEQFEKDFVVPKKGELVKGKVVSVSDKEIVVNIGYKADGIIPKSEVSNNDVNLKEFAQEGQELEVYILKKDDGDGNVLLSLKRIAQLKDWTELEKLAEDATTITVTIKEAVKGGVIAYYNEIRGFIPASQIALHYVNDLSVYVGQTIEAKILEVNKNKRRAVFTRKQLLSEELSEKKAELWGNISEGAVVKGEVKRITSFGAFVDIGGLDGLIHISEMSWGRIKSPKEAVKIGDTVEVKVLTIDKETEKVSLSLKQVKNDPWIEFDNNYKVNDVVSAKVVNLTDFGAFLEIEPGLEGLVHISQISAERIEKPADVLKIGDACDAKIIEVNLEERKIKLSIRAIDEPETAEVQE
ncbi:30S ribosomal protein S1 [Acidaminobacter sp. JC074]|uniref:30S ribosomal protein S1 n=1 Tax=Acidaminobacter sp. JC074 TaxID=2530199 RepID=UPI001F0EBB08|nr:30S ribosomal protein S1 [Acidaminobacter sp. JC074]MCH4888851.1 30S ribosomal protein S1 [Acidaminobacter sp. JC074]